LAQPLRDRLSLEAITWRYYHPLGIPWGDAREADENNYPGHVREFGYAEVRARGHTKLLAGLEDFSTTEGHGMLKVWMSHGDKVTELPPGFALMASTPSCPIAGMADERRGYYAVQFHPEVTHTVKGRELLERFVLQICAARPDWVMGNYIDEAVARIRAQVGGDEVILGLSGGVDSSVAAALIHKAIGDRLTCVFVDHGLLRLNEGDMVMEMFAGKLHAKVIRVDASEVFLRPNNLTVTKDGKKVYVTTGRGRKVFVIDTSSYQVLASLEVGERPWGIALTPDGKKLYTANGPSDDVSVVDVDSQKVVARIRVGTRPWGVAIVP
jgi:YVTN family beta-propeller protein